MQLSALQLISGSNEDYPLKVSNKKLGCSLDVNLDNRSVALRNVYERAIFKVQEAL